MGKRARVAWVSYFPIEWLPQLPPELRALPRQHPASWQRVLLEELKPRRDVELHVVVVRKQFPRHCTFDLERVTFHCLKVPGGMRSLSLFWWETALIRKRLRQIQPDLVHAWGTERGAALVASRCPYPYLVSMQGLLQWYLEAVDLGWHTKLEARLEQISLRRASVVTVESAFGVNWLRTHYPNLQIRQVEHAPAWIFHQVQRQPLTRPPRFLFVGILSLIKGTDLLFKALDRLCPELDFRLTTVGASKPELMVQLKKQISPRVWERVTTKQGLTPAEIAEELASATMVLFPTRADNSPNSIKEAAVAGVPVVASAVGGIVDYIRTGLNGITFPAGDLEAFTQAIRSAVAHPLFGQGKVDPATLEQVRRYLSPAVMREGFQAAYEQVLARA